MRQVVADVRQIRMARPHALHHGESFGHREVRGMWTMAQGIKDKNVEPLEQRPRLIRQPVAVGQVGERAEAIAKDRALAMKERHRLNADRADLEAARDGGQVDLWNAAALFAGRVEDVREGVAQVIGRALIRIRRDRPTLHHIEPAHIVQAHHVIGVAVREQDGVDARDAIGECLLP